MLHHNNEEIHADEYEKRAGDELCCPDPFCNARMTYVKESEEQAAFKREAHFRTLPSQKHREGCDAHREERDFKQRMDTIKQAAAEHKKILFSLNDLETSYGLPTNMKRDFGSASSVAFSLTELATFKSDNRGHYVSQSVRQIFSLVSMLNVIDAVAGPPAFNRVFFTWQGDVRPYEEVVCMDAEAEKTVFKRLYEKSKDLRHPHSFDAYGHQGAYGFPRFIEFTPARRGRNGQEHIVFGAQRLVNRDQSTGACLYLQNAIDMRKLDGEARKRLLSGGAVRLIAAPKVNRSLAKEAFDRYKEGQTASAWLIWNVMGDHQFQMLKKDARLSRPLPASPKGKQLNLL